MCERCKESLDWHRQRRNFLKVAGSAAALGIVGCGSLPGTATRSNSRICAFSIRNWGAESLTGSVPGSDRIRVSGDYGVSRCYSGLIFAALMIGRHFAISAFCNSASAARVCCSRGKISCAKSARRDRTLGSAKASTVAALSLAMKS